MTATNNNTLVHKYLVPLIENIDFDGCENNSNIKAVISKLMTIAKNTMKKEQEPGDTSDIKIDDMKGAVILDTQADKPKKDTESKKDTEQSDEHDSESSDDSTGSSTKKQHIEKKNIKTPGKVDDESDINKDIDITIINSDIDDSASDEE